MLSLKRGYWVVESRLHHCLDVTLREDQSRVRTPSAARVLGTIRRVVVSLANTAVNRARKKKSQDQVQHQQFSKTIPFGSRRARTTPGCDFRQIPKCAGLPHCRLELYSSDRAA